MAAKAPAKPLVVAQVVFGDIWTRAKAQVYQLSLALQANRTAPPKAVPFTDSALLGKLKAAGRTHLSQEFNKDKIALKYEALYKSIYYEPARPQASIFHSTLSQP